MNGYLKQSTAGQVRTIGPFVDDTDFKTLENALTIANTDIVISANGGADTTKNSGGATAHGAGGIYTLTWDATDTAAVGELSYSVKVAGALVCFGTYVVLEEAVYDALFAASAPGYVANAPVNVAQFGGSNLTSASGIPEVKVNNIAANAITTASINDGAITDAKVADDVKVDVNTIKGQTVTLAGGVTIPAATLASTTNITAGTVTTATNVTTVNGLANNVITAASIATDAIDADALAADAVTEIATGVWGFVVQGTRTATKAVRLMLAALTGKASGLGTATAVYRNPEDTIDAITATVDASGNRTAVTLDDSA